MIAAGEIGRPHFVHGAYLQDWLLKPTDFSWRLEPEKGGASSAFADIGSHWCDLAQHVTGQRIVAVLADCATVVPMRRRPATSRAAFSDGSPARATRGGRGGRRLPGDERRSRHHPGALRRRREGSGQRGPGVRRTQERSLARGQRIDHVVAMAAGAAKRALDRPARRGQHDAGERSRAVGARGRAICALARRTSGGMGGCLRQRHARHLRLHHRIAASHVRRRWRRSRMATAWRVSSTPCSRVMRRAASGHRYGSPRWSGAAR